MSVGNAYSEYLLEWLKDHRLQDAHKRITKLEKDAERYQKIKQMTFPQFKALVSERMDGSGKTLDELVDKWESGNG